MKGILKLLKTDMLTEAEVSVLTEKLELLIADKVNEKVDEKIVSIKEELEVEYNEKLASHISEVTANFSDFLDKVIDEELEIPQKVLDFAKKGELYSDLIEDFKIRLTIDEGYLTDEIKETMIEAKNEIVSLKDQLNKQIDENMELKDDNKKLTSIAYINEKCDGLTSIQKTKIVSLLEGIIEQSEIDRKFDLIVETFDIAEACKKKNEDDDEDCKDGEECNDEDETDGKGQKEVEKEIKDEEDEEKEIADGFKDVMNSFKRVLTEKTW